MFSRLSDKENDRVSTLKFAVGPLVYHQHDTCCYVADNRPPGNITMAASLFDKRSGGKKERILLGISVRFIGFLRFLVLFGVQLYEFYIFLKTSSYIFGTKNSQTNFLAS